MAAGEAAGADGRAWITAAAVAYEVQCRLCDAASIRARGWDHTTYGSISSALAAARLLKLSHEQTVHALGIAGTTAAALRLTRAGELSMWKGCAFASRGPERGLRRAAGRRGMTGPAPLFEGEMGFFQQVSGPFSLPKLGGPAAGDWMLPKTSIKFVPAEYHSQSAIAAAFALRPQIADPRGFATIEIATFRMAVEIIGKDPEKWRPKTRETADHSLPYCTAVALVDGADHGRAVHGRAARRPRPARPGRATRVVEDPQLTAGYPAGIPNRVTVTLDDGTEARERGRFSSRPRPEPTFRRSARRQVPRPDRPGPGARSCRPDLGAGLPPRKRPCPARDARVLWRGHRPARNGSAGSLAACAATCVHFANQNIGTTICRATELHRRVAAERPTRSRAARAMASPAAFEGFGVSQTWGSQPSRRLTRWSRTSSPIR